MTAKDVSSYKYFEFITILCHCLVKLINFLLFTFHVTYQIYVMW